MQRLTSYIGRIFHHGSQSLGIAALTAINMVVTYGYQWYVVRLLGVNLQTDVLFAGMVVPQLILAVVSGSLSFVIVPLLAEQPSEIGFKSLSWTFFNAIGILFLSIAIVLTLTAHLWVPWTVPGFGLYAKDLTISLTRVHLIGMVFTSLLSVGWAVYYAKHRFLWVEGSGAIASTMGLAFLVVMLPSMGIFAVAWAMTLRSFLQVLMLLPGMGRPMLPDLKNAAFLKLWHRLYPLLIGSSYSKTDQLVDRFLASMALPGQLSLLYLSQQLFGAGNQILTKAISNPALPRMAVMANNKKWSDLISTVKSRLSFILYTTIAILLIIGIFGKYLLGLVFGLSTAESNTFWMILICISGIWIGGAIGQILTIGFYSFGETVTPTRIGVFGFTLGIVLKIYGFKYFGIIGLAIGTSIYMIINSILHYYFLFRKLRIFQKDII